MSRVPITVMGFKCDRCNHEWIPRGDGEQEPKACPQCKSPYWNSPRKNAPPMSYESFRDTVRDVLVRAGRGLTWTEVRTEAKLPQALPNNQWVRRMEVDIRLMRQRDSRGILLWAIAEPTGDTIGQVSEPEPTDRTRRRPAAQQGRLE